MKSNLSTEPTPRSRLSLKEGVSMLEVSHLTKKYKNNRGASDITFGIKQGEVLALLGPNGAGKTTILKSITNLIEKDSGQVTINGVSMTDQYEQYISCIGAMIGETVHLEYMTAIQQMQVKGVFYKTETDVLEDLLEIVGLYDYKDDKIKTFSTGMKQRLALAYALIGKPDILLLDEPFSGMDVDGKRQMRNLLADLAEKKEVGIVVSSHLVNEVELLYTKMAVLQDGHIISYADATAVKESGLTLEDYYVNKCNLQGNVKRLERRTAV